MPIIQTRLDTHSPDYEANHAHMQALVDDLRDKLATISEGGGEASMQRHISRGKLPVREGPAGAFQCQQP